MYMNAKHDRDRPFLRVDRYYIAVVVSICICIERNNVAHNASFDPPIVLTCNLASEDFLSAVSMRLKSRKHVSLLHNNVVYINALSRVQNIHTIHRAR